MNTKRSLMLVMLLLVTSGALLFLFVSKPHTFYVNIGEPHDDGVAKNFYEPEAGAGAISRRTRLGSRLVIYGMYTGQSLLSLKCHGEQDLDPRRDRRLELVIDKQGRISFSLANVSSWRVYTVLLPFDGNRDFTSEQTRIDLLTHDTRSSQGEYASGIPLDWMGIQPLDMLSAPWEKPLWRTLSLLSMLAGLSGMLWHVDRIARKRSWLMSLIRLHIPIGICAVGLIAWAWLDPYTLFRVFSSPPWVIVFSLLALLTPLWARATTWLSASSTSGTGRHVYTGIFLLSLATLMFQSLLTRIFSVTMWYHYAFMAVSVTMFGMTFGATLVYLLPRLFVQEKITYHLALNALLFAISIVGSFLLYIKVPSFAGEQPLVMTFVMMTIPFVFSGVSITLALTKFPTHVSNLYAVDLLGAAAGCILFVVVLDMTDGPTAIMIAALIASGSAIFFILPASTQRHTAPYRTKHVAVLATFLLACFVIVNTFLVYNQASLLRLQWVKGKYERHPYYEQWNSFSRITILDNPQEASTQIPFGWGLSSEYSLKRKVREVNLHIDAGAGTVITHFDGNLERLEHLKYDLTNIAQYLRSNANVLVIGSGGGRDVLTALAFHQNSVVRIEMNDDTTNVVNDELGYFTGYLSSYPNVRFINDEARSSIARMQETFDIIQISFIDTWAATAAGGFVLSENSLYTLEAWETFLNRLNPQGILTVSHLYFRDGPGEIYRFVSLANAALTKMGIPNTRDHVMVLRRMWKNDPSSPDGMGTVLVSKEPFSQHDMQIIEQVCEKMKFEIVFSPFHEQDPVFGSLASGEKASEFTRDFPLDIAPPTDDRPFFFYMTRLQDALHASPQESGPRSFSLKAIHTLARLLIVATLLTLLFIIIPLFLTSKKEVLTGGFAPFLFFVCIGFGFMLIEISQMQRLAIFLGHPTYSLLVVLSTLLLSSGIGSSLTQNVTNHQLRTAGTNRFLALLLILALFGAFTPYITHTFQFLSTPLRIALAVAILVPIGICMGMCFPLGMKAAATRSTSLVPWLWGVNGATSVLASVLAVVLSLSFGISVAFWVGFACYIGATLAFLAASRRLNIMV